MTSKTTPPSSPAGCTDHICSQLPCYQLIILSDTAPPNPMVTFDSLPSELHEKIIEEVISSGLVPAPDYEQDLQEDRQQVMDVAYVGLSWRNRVKWQKKQTPHSADALLRVNHQVRAQAKAAWKRVAHRVPCVVDIMFAAEEDLRPTFLSVFTDATHFDLVHAQFRVVGLPDPSAVKVRFGRRLNRTLRPGSAFREVEFYLNAFERVRTPERAPKKCLSDVTARAKHIDALIAELDEDWVRRSNAIERRTEPVEPERGVQVQGSAFREKCSEREPNRTFTALGHPSVFPTDMQTRNPRFIWAPYDSSVPAVKWMFFDLLQRFLKAGPWLSQSRKVDRHITVQRLEINVLSPKDTSLLSPENALQSWRRARTHRRLTQGNDPIPTEVETRAYGGIFYERIGEIAMLLDGKEKTVFKLGDMLAELPMEYPGGFSSQEARQRVIARRQWEKELGVAVENEKKIDAPRLDRDFGGCMDPKVKPS
ncbi:hypothetical protein B0H12DRAFT_1067595 [Mycena haematopus]|nr:hypothetical protein B0H12DRAFT_1067595 [Mycena haematopus]